MHILIVTVYPIHNCVDYNFDLLHLLWFAAAP